jgi:hypothetical protein
VLALRAVLAVAMILCGIVILTRMLLTLAAGFAVLPGIVLAGALIALGAHRISLILRAGRRAS